MTELKDRVAEKPDVLFNAIDEITRQENHCASLQSYLEREFGLPEGTLKKKTRKREVVNARQVYAYFLVRKTKASLATIGREIGDKDHATVIHCRRAVENFMDTEPRYQRLMKRLEEDFRHHSIILPELQEAL